jgi:hypothetical protein
MKRQRKTIANAIGFSRLFGRPDRHSPAIEMRVADVILERNGFPQHAFAAK